MEWSWTRFIAGIIAALLILPVIGYFFLASYWIISICWGEIGNFVLGIAMWIIGIAGAYAIGGGA